jgi:hypothetical protein
MISGHANQSVLQRITRILWDQQDVGHLYLTQSHKVTTINYKPDKSFRLCGFVALCEKKVFNVSLAPARLREIGQQIVRAADSGKNI